MLMLLKIIMFTVITTIITVGVLSIPFVIINGNRIETPKPPKKNHKK